MPRSILEDFEQVYGAQRRRLLKQENADQLEKNRKALEALRKSTACILLVELVGSDSALNAISALPGYLKGQWRSPYQACEGDPVRVETRDSRLAKVLVSLGWVEREEPPEPEVIPWLRTSMRGFSKAPAARQRLVVDGLARFMQEAARAETVAALDDLVVGLASSLGYGARRVVYA